MGFDSIWHWLLLLVIVLVIFGTGKLTKMGPDLGNALRGFKKAMQDNEEEKSEGADSEKLKADPPPATDKTETKQERAHSTTAE